MIIVQVCEAVQPEITKDHRVKIEPGKIAEAEAGAHKDNGDKRKGRGHGNRDVPPGWIKEDVKRGRKEGDRKPVTGDINQGYAANDDVNANQETQPEAFSSALMISHTSGNLCGGISPRSGIAQSPRAHNPP
jgi:hypothetical protein